MILFNVEVRLGRSIQLAALGALVLVSRAAADEPANGLRRYADGPLTPNDFLGRPPSDSVRTAMSYPRLHWDHEYETRPDGRAVVARLVRIRVLAVIDRRVSWTRSHATTLLDHEQGHFDLTQIAALEQEIRFRQQILAGTAPTGRGTDRPSAVSDLHRKIEKAMEAVVQATVAQHAAYDEDTDHGRDPAEQAGHRLRHREKIADLARKRTAMEKSK